MSKKKIPAQRGEVRVAKQYGAEGWTVLVNKGAPDLLMFKNINGSMQMKFREVKSATGDRLNPDQITDLKTLHDAGFDAGTTWVDLGIETTGGQHPSGMHSNRKGKFSMILRISVELRDRM